MIESELRYCMNYGVRTPAALPNVEASIWPLPLGALLVLHYTVATTIAFDGQLGRLLTTL